MSCEIMDAVEVDDNQFTERNVTPNPLVAMSIEAAPVTAIEDSAPALADMSETQSPQAPAQQDTAYTRKAALDAITDTLKTYGLDLMGVLPEIASRGHIAEGASASAVLKLPVATLEIIATQADAIGAEAKERREGVTQQ